MKVFVFVFWGKEQIESCIDLLAVSKAKKKKETNKISLSSLHWSSNWSLQLLGLLTDMPVIDLVHSSHSLTWPSGRCHRPALTEQLFLFIYLTPWSSQIMDRLHLCVTLVCGDQ